MRRRIVVILLGVGIGAAALAVGWWVFTQPPSAGTVTSIPAAPFEPRGGSAVVWTGGELIVWGGGGFDWQDGTQSVFAGGAAYDRQSRSWRPLAPSPLTERGEATAVWTGREVLVWAGSSSGLLTDGAAYDPAADTWRPMSESPLSPRTVGPTAAVWTGSELVVYGGNTAVGKEEPAQDGAAYDPETNSWRLLAEDPIPDAAYHHLLWTGTHVLLFADLFIDEEGRLLENEGNPMRVAAWDPATNRWDERPAPQTGFLNANLPAVWTGDRVLTVTPNTYDSQCCPHDGSPLPPAGGLYDPVSGDWQETPWSPIGLYPAAPTVWTGTRALIADAAHGRRGAYDPEIDACTILSMPGVSDRAFPVSVWTGSTLILWGGTPAEEHDPTTAFTDGYELVIGD